MKILDSLNKINKIITNSKQIFIVGHKFLDLDALGSAIGMYYYISNLNKEVYIIVDDNTKEKAVAKIINETSDIVRYITSSKALKLKHEDSVLMIVDTNKSYLLQNPILSDSFNTKIIIDHHQLTSDSIRANLMVVDTESSSTCEMVTEFLKENDFMIDSYLATILLSGIVLDTNNYVLKTNSNTFYYSYYLTICGALPQKVQYLLKQDLKKYIKRQKMITNVKIINHIALTKGASNDKYRREELAKTADTLLLFDNISASFVVAKLDKNSIGISARSMGDINVGQVLTMFDGGGNFSEAAAVITGSSINDVEKKLLSILKLL